MRHFAPTGRPQWLVCGSSADSVRKVCRVCAESLETVCSECASLRPKKGPKRALLGCLCASAAAPPEGESKFMKRLWPIACWWSRNANNANNADVQPRKTPLRQTKRAPKKPFCSHWTTNKPQEHTLNGLPPSSGCSSVLSIWAQQSRSAFQEAKKPPPKGRPHALPCATSGRHKRSILHIRLGGAWRAVGEQWASNERRVCDECARLMNRDCVFSNLELRTVCPDLRLALSSNKWPGLVGVSSPDD